MEYAKLIDAAKKRHGWSDYRVAKALKYKNISTIYQVRNGKKGMTAERYRALLLLAYGELKRGNLYIMSTRHEAANEAFCQIESMRYAA